MNDQKKRTRLLFGLSQSTRSIADHNAKRTEITSSNLTDKELFALKNTKTPNNKEITAVGMWE